MNLNKNIQQKLCLDRHTLLNFKQHNYADYNHVQKLYTVVTCVWRSSECCHLSSSCSYWRCLCSYATRSLKVTFCSMSGSVGHALWQCSNQSLKLSWASYTMSCTHLVSNTFQY